MSSLERQANFLNFFERQKVAHCISHAYLLIGKNDTFEVALEMAKRIFCEHGGCGQCGVCQRIDAGDFADLRIISGKEASIKKQEIIALKETMAQTTLESKQKKVYILQDVDQASIAALNSLLKFLEEPESDIVAILTTQNVHKVIETIQSRCMLVHLKPMMRVSLVNEIMEAGYPEREALYLSHIAENKNEAVVIGENPLFISLVDLFDQLIRYYERREFELAGIAMQVAFKDKKMDLKSIQWLCAMHLAYYHDIKKKDAKLLPVLRATLTIQDRIHPGVIGSMLMDQFAYELLREASL